MYQKLNTHVEAILDVDLKDDSEVLFYLLSENMLVQAFQNFRIACVPSDIDSS